MSAFYNGRIGFFGMLSPGQYQCETFVNGRIFRSDIYTVEDEGKWLCVLLHTVSLKLDGGFRLTSLQDGHSMRSLFHDGPVSATCTHS